ncbi:MAG: hypothetical protein WAX85_03375 [Minisyncoccia bacterium]
MEPNDKIESFKEKSAERELKSMHYYGDTTRILYVVMAVVMLVATPFVKNDLPFPADVSIFAVLVLSVLAGFTNPKSKDVLYFDFAASVISLLFFGYEMIISYNGPYTKLFFYVNILLSVLAMFSLYLSSKTLRGNLQSKSE